MTQTEKAPACQGEGKKKDWRERANPLMADILDQHFPFVKGSPRFELVEDNEKEESR